MKLLGTICTAGLLLGTASAGLAGNALGINFDAPMDSSGSRVLADIAKSSRGSDGSVDALGNPTSTGFNVIMWGETTPPNDQLHGTYAVSFTGQVTSITSWVNTGGFSIQPTGGSWSAAYNASTSKTTATMVITDSGNYNFGLTFAGAYRDAAKTQPGLTNLSIMRPSSPGSATPLAAGTVGYPSFIAQLAPFSVLRFMDFTATNGNIQINWSDRTVPGNFTYQNQATGYGWQGKGAPWEIAAQLANQANKDAWINIPTQASFDYVYKVAQLFKCGSDGVNPWIQSDNVTCRTGTPAYPPLNNSLKLYVEYANEIWNTAPGFTQNQMAIALTDAEPVSSPIHYDDASNPQRHLDRFVAMRSAQVSLIFRTVFGDAAMPSTGNARVRPVLETQAASPLGPVGIGSGLIFAESFMNNGIGSHVPASNWVVPSTTTQVSAHPPTYYWYGGGGGSYFRTADTSSAQAAISSGEFIPSNWIASPDGYMQDLPFPLPFGLKRIAYEGGPNFGDGPDPGNSAIFTAARLLGRSSGTPNFTDVIESQHDYWTAHGGDLFMYFTLSTGYSYGLLTSNIYESGTPALVAFNELSTRASAAVTVGQPIPGSLPGATHVINQRGFGDGAAGAENFNTTDPQNRVVWAGYVFHSTTAANQNVVLTIGASPAGAVSVWVDGAQVAFNQTAVAGTMTFPAGTLAAGAHGVIVRANSGQFSLTSLAIQSSAVAPVAAFSCSPLTGAAPLTVTCTDASTNSPTGWNWTFGDSGTSTSQNPSHSYAAAGTYTVALTASNSAGSNTLTKASYISVSATGGSVTPNPVSRGQTITVTDTFKGNANDSNAMVIFWIQDSANNLLGRCGPNSTSITLGVNKTVSCTLAIPTTATPGAYHTSGTVYKSATDLTVLEQLPTFATFTIN
jgi:PKD repeat protein